MYLRNFAGKSKPSGAGITPFGDLPPSRAVPIVRTQNAIISQLIIGWFSGVSYNIQDASQCFPGRRVITFLLSPFNARFRSIISRVRRDYKLTRFAAL